MRTGPLFFSVIFLTNLLRGGPSQTSQIPVSPRLESHYLDLRGARLTGSALEPHFGAGVP